METFDCQNPKKRKLCQKRCPTCYKRSFASVEITKNYGDETTTFKPANFWSEKNKIKPQYINRTSNSKYMFDCWCGHEIELRLTDCYSRGNWCSYHVGKKLCGSEACNFCYEKSFASVEKEWGKPSDYILEGNPLVISKQSHKKCTFVCPDCNHTFESAIYNVSSRDWPCSYCNGDKLCGSMDCSRCIDRSFLYHPKAIYWSKINKTGSNLVLKQSNKKHWFDCDVCGHSFESRITNIYNNDAWCPYCSVPCRKLCGAEECNFCFEKSLASLVDEKNYLADNQPSLWTIQKGGRSKKYKFICDKGHEFSMRPNNINNYQWCPLCPKKTEAKMYSILQKMFPKKEIICQATFEWCKSPKSGRSLYYDFYLPHLSLIVEIDGPQHFKQISNWCDPKKVQKIDKHKERCAVDNDISVIRLLQVDVLFDKNDWVDAFDEGLSFIQDWHRIGWNIVFTNDGEVSKMTGYILEEHLRKV